MQIMCICNVMSGRGGMLDAAVERTNVLATMLVKTTNPRMCTALAFHACRTARFRPLHNSLSNLATNAREQKKSSRPRFFLCSLLTKCLSIIKDNLIIILITIEKIVHSWIWSELLWTIEIQMYTLDSFLIIRVNVRST